VATLATAAALVSGIVSMAHGGRFDVRHSHQLMLARVAFQGVALFLLIVTLLLSLR
jgi:hypothetical protein